ncbi:MAG: hypothetical protein R8P61_14785 [Bacteroidia bacterium]|nr:hypothetical protein [Bacteroidia bacterium]
MRILLLCLIDILPLMGFSQFIYTDFYMGYAEDVTINLAVHSDSTYCMRWFNTEEEFFLGRCLGEIEYANDTMTFSLSSLHYVYNTEDSSYFFQDTSNTDFCPFQHLYIPDIVKLKLVSKKKLIFLGPDFPFSDRAISVKRKWKKERYCSLYYYCNTNKVNNPKRN